MFEVGKVLKWQCWKLCSFIQRCLTETQMQHQLLQTDWSSCFHILWERLWLSEHEKISLLIPDLATKTGSSRVLLQYQLYFFFARGFLDCGWITQRITSIIPCSLVAAVGENYQGAATFAPNLMQGKVHSLPSHALPLQNPIFWAFLYYLSPSFMI